jgi:hypothetical protein
MKSGGRKWFLGVAMSVVEKVTKAAGEKAAEYGWELFSGAFFGVFDGFSQFSLGDMLGRQGQNLFPGHFRNGFSFF